MSKEFTPEDTHIIKEIMQYRRDVRGNRFTDKNVPSEVIDQILEAALYAPSVGYSQPWQFIVIDDQNIKQKVFNSFTEENNHAKTLFSGKKKQSYAQLKLEGILESPINIAVFYQPSEKTILGQTSMSDMGRFSVVCAIQNMWLMARSLNVGVGWVSIVDPKKVKAAVNAPKNSELIAYLCVGYVNEFLDEPELKTKKWEEEKHKEDIIFKNTFK
ncbi:5,6-dimethylbenzimidazole synthase [Colwellia sp. RE-S-Sl-9]